MIILKAGPQKKEKKAPIHRCLQLLIRLVIVSAPLPSRMIFISEVSHQGDVALPTLWIKYMAARLWGSGINTFTVLLSSAAIRLLTPHRLDPPFDLQSHIFNAMFTSMTT